MSNIYEICSLYCNFYPILIMLFLYAYISIGWDSIFQKISWLKKYSATQRVHEGEVPRLGGLILIIGLFSFLIFSQGHTDNKFLYTLLVTSTPLYIIGLKEDLMHNTKALNRLTVMFLISFLFFYNYEIIFPKIEVPLVGDLFENSPIITFLFYSLCSVILMNGNNLIDGANGLMVITNLMQCLSLIVLMHFVGNFDLLSNIILLKICLLVFLLFNYPLGKIFMGDLGAYFVGFFIGAITIDFFGRNPTLHPINAVLILFYPTFELFFSIIRKFVKKNNPLLPDHEHLHLKIFYFYKNKFINGSFSNVLVAPTLFLVWAMPTIGVILFHENEILILSNIFIMIVIYFIFFYKLFSKNAEMLQKNNK